MVAWTDCATLATLLGSKREFLQEFIDVRTIRNGGRPQQKEDERMRMFVLFCLIVLMGCSSEVEPSEPGIPAIRGFSLGMQRAQVEARCAELEGEWLYSVETAGGPMGTCNVENVGEYPFLQEYHADGTPVDPSEREYLCGVAGREWRDGYCWRPFATHWSFHFVFDAMDRSANVYAGMPESECELWKLRYSEVLEGLTDALGQPVGHDGMPVDASSFASECLVPTVVAYWKDASGQTVAALSVHTPGDILNINASLGYRDP